MTITAKTLSICDPYFPKNLKYLVLLTVIDHTVIFHTECIQKWHLNSDNKICTKGALSGSFGPCLATVMKMHILFLHYAVLNNLKYPLLEGNLDSLIRSIDTFLVEKP